MPVRLSAIEPHQVANDARHGRADHQRRHHVREADDGEQIGRDHAASAEEGGLSEGEQAGEAEQDVEADPEHTPNQNAVDRRRRESKVRQDEGRGDQPDGGQRLDHERTLPNPTGTALIRGRPCRAARRDAA